MERFEPNAGVNSIHKSTEALTNADHKLIHKDVQIWYKYG